MAGDAPLPRSTWAWVGALFVAEAFGHLRNIDRFLEAYAKGMKKAKRKRRRR